MSYGIIFWGNSPVSDNVFKIQKRAIRIISQTKKHESCRQLFEQLEILTLTSQYIYSLLSFVVNNQHLFLKNSDVRYHNTTHRTNFYVPPARLTMAQKGVLYSGITLFNELPDEIKKFSDTPKILKET